MSNFIRLENAAVFLVTLCFYLIFDYSLLIFLLLLLVPDVFMFGYLINKEIGSRIYNIGHTYIVPIFITLIFFLVQEALILQIALIWLAHISMDRAFGFGLKYAFNFEKTTIQKI